jgi:hypothetical protein
MVLNTIFGCINPPEWMKRRKTAASRNNNDKRRRFCGGFTLSQLLVSVGSDLDMITDWLYYEKVVSSYSQADSTIPSSILISLSIFLVIATILWVLEIVEGRLGCQRCCGLRLKNCYILWAGIWLEDIPQIVLTILIDSVYASSGTAFSVAGAINIAASIHNALTKVRALVDDDVEEHDKVEDEPLLEDEGRLSEQKLSTLAAEV